MNRLISVFIIILVLSAIFSSCTEDQAVQAPEAQSSLVVTILDAPEKITAFAEIRAEIPVTIQVTNQSGKAQPGKEIYVTDNITGVEVQERNLSTNAQGFAEGLLMVTLPEGAHTFRIMANCEGSVTTQNVQAIVYATPQTIRQPDQIRRLALGQTDLELEIPVTVLNSRGIGVPQVPLRLGIRAPFGSEVFGRLTPVETTDENGEAILIFHSGGGSGEVFVSCEVDLPLETPVIGETSIVLTAHEQMQNLTLSSDPSELSPRPNETATSIITAVVRDDEYNPVPKIWVGFTTNLGSIEPLGMTDENGVTQVQFTCGANYGIAAISGTVIGHDWENQLLITINDPLAGDFGLTLSSSRGSIWADNRSEIELTARLFNELNQPIVGEEIEFQAVYGSVVTPTVTDEFGVARTVYRYFGIELPIEGVASVIDTITARYPLKSLSSEVEITIRQRDPITEISLSARARQMIAGSGQTTQIDARCYYANGTPAAEGIEVNFDAVYGRFPDRGVSTTNNNGIATIEYEAGNIVGTDTLLAWVQTPLDTAYSNQTMIDLIPGPPCIIVMSANPNTLYIGDPQSTSTITVTVMDTSGNPVRQGTFVSFTTTLGSITPSAVTYADGDAIALLSPGAEAGIARVTATVNTAGRDLSTQTTITFVSGQVSAIELTANPLQIAVAGTGGVSTSTLRATVRDANGNLVEGNVPVYFELINEPDPPAGCTIGPVGQIYRSLTQNGVAVASLNAGTQIGGKLIRAFCYPDSLNEPNRVVEVTNSVVAVVAGPPFALDLDVNELGVDAGGGAVRLEVSVRVWDIHRNPVAPGTPIMLSVEPEIAHIEWTEVGENGLGICNLFYQSRDTFSEIEIFAEIQTQRGPIGASRVLILPLWRGELSLSVDPGNWMFNEDNEQAEIRCWATLVDGHGVLINNAPILFSTTRSRLWWKDFSNDRYIIFFPEPSIKYTGVIDRQNNEMPGQATVYLRAEEEDIFLDPFQAEMNVSISAEVDGYDLPARTVFVGFTRRQ